MEHQGVRVVIDPRDMVAADGVAAVVAPTRPVPTPLRAALLVVGTIVGGVALSLILGTSPAHAADGDGAADPGGLFGDDTSLVPTVTTATSETATQVASTAASTLDTTVASTVTVVPTAVVPPVQALVQTTGDTVVLVVPITAPVVYPVLAALTGQLTAATGLVDPVHKVLWTAAAATDAPHGLVALATKASAIVADAASGTAAPLPSPGLRGGADGTLPVPLLTSSGGGPAAVLGPVLLILALALLVARRRLDDDMLPPSPVFETDTSPA